MRIRSLVLSVVAYSSLCVLSACRTASLESAFQQQICSTGHALRGASNVRDLSGHVVQDRSLPSPALEQYCDGKPAPRDKRYLFCSLDGSWCVCDNAATCSKLAGLCEGGYEVAGRGFGWNCNYKAISAVEVGDACGEKEFVGSVTEFSVGVLNGKKMVVWKCCAETDEKHPNKCKDIKGEDWKVKS